MSFVHIPPAVWKEVESAHTIKQLIIVTYWTPAQECFHRTYLICVLLPLRCGLIELLLLLDLLNHPGGLTVLLLLLDLFNHPGGLTVLLLLLDLFSNPGWPTVLMLISSLCFALLSFSCVSN